MSFLKRLPVNILCAVTVVMLTTHDLWAVKPTFADYGKAPEFKGIDKWLNSEPLKQDDLRGKVVLVDFWTYTCINCRRTIPYVNQWYEKYKDHGLVVVGVHTPEFDKEKETAGVLRAIERLDIHYPVAQDNRYATWKAYSNQYWPAVYLIDKKGSIVLKHIGEGSYEEIDNAIATLLKEDLPTATQ